MIFVLQCLVCARISRDLYNQRQHIMTHMMKDGEFLDRLDHFVKSHSIQQNSNSFSCLLCRYFFVCLRVSSTPNRIFKGILGSERVMSFFESCEIPKNKSSASPLLPNIKFASQLQKLIVLISSYYIISHHPPLY